MQKRVLSSCSSSCVEAVARSCVLNGWARCLRCMFKKREQTVHEIGLINIVAAENIVPGRIRTCDSWLASQVCYHYTTGTVDQTSLDVGVILSCHSTPLLAKKERNECADRSVC